MEEKKFTAKEDQKQSGFGIASFILAMLTMLSYIILATFGTSMIEPYLTPDGPLTPPKEALRAMSILAAVFILVVAMNFVGLLIGLAGSLNKNSKRSFAIIGAILNGTVLVTMLLLFLFVLNG